MKKFQIGELVDRPDGVYIVVSGPMDGNKWLATHPIGSLCVSQITGCVCELIGLPDRVNPVFVPEDAGAIGVISPVQTVIRCLSLDEMLDLKTGTPLLLSCGRDAWAIDAEVTTTERTGNDFVRVRIDRIIYQAPDMNLLEGDVTYVQRVELTRRPPYPRTRQRDTWSNKGWVEVTTQGFVVNWPDGNRDSIKIDVSTVLALRAPTDPNELAGENITTTDGKWKIIRVWWGLPGRDPTGINFRSLRRHKGVMVSRRGLQRAVAQAQKKNIIK